MAESNLEIQLRVSGLRTIRDMENHVKNLTKSLKDLDTESERFKKLSKEKEVVQTKLNAAKKMGWSEDAKLRDSYFKTGEELRRRTLPLMGGLANTIQMMPSGIRSVTSSLDMLVLQFVRLSGKAGGAGGAIKSLMSSMMGPAGIALAVSLITSLAFTFGDKLFTSVKKTREEIDRLKAGFKDIDEFSNFGDRPMSTEGVQKRTEELLARIEVLGKQRILPEYSTAGKMIPLDADELAFNLELDRELNAIKKEIVLMDRENIERQEKLAETGKRLAEEQRARDVAAGFGPTGGKSTVPFGGFRGVSAAEQAKIMATNPITATDKYGEAQDAFTLKKMQEGIKQAAELSKTLQQGAQQFSQTLISGLMHGKDIASTIGLALLGVFTNVVSGGITSLLTGGAGGAVGGSLSAQKVIPKLAPTGQPQLVTRWKADEVAIFVQRGNAMLERNKK